MALRKECRGRRDSDQRRSLRVCRGSGSADFSDISRRHHAGFLKVLEMNCPRLRADILRPRMIGRLRGFGGATSYLRQCHGAGWALVGDAGYFKDPLTAHGITDALRDAQLLSGGIVNGGTRALRPTSASATAIPAIHARHRRDRLVLVGPRRGQAASCAIECRHDDGDQSHRELVTSALSRSIGAGMSNSPPWTRTLAGRPALGSRAERSRTTTMRDVEMFTEMTGDRNPIHYDLELAAGIALRRPRRTRRRDHGSPQCRCCRRSPGPGTVFLGTNWRFVKAVRVGETIPQASKSSTSGTTSRSANSRQLSATQAAKFAS